MNLPDTQTLLLGVVAGIGIGCVYALVAIAFNLVLAASGVFNLTQSAVITGAIMLSYIFTVREHMQAWLIVPILVVLGAAAGSLSELIAVRRFLRVARSLSHETMVSTLGLGLVGTSLAAIIFDTDVFPVPSYLPTTPVVVGGLPIRPLYFLLPVVALVITVAIELILRHSTMGIVMRSVIADPEGSEVAGISVAWVVQCAFIAAGALAALAGFLVAPITSASVFVGDSVQLYGFAAIAIGGFGSFRGALIGGLIVGLVSGLTPAFTEPTWSRPLVYFLVVVVLFLRPAGLFGRAGLFGAAAARQV